MTSIFHDIRADEVQALADDMREWREHFVLSRCESRSHKEHHGELWQCDECLRLFCWAEGAADDSPGRCDDCWVRLHDHKPLVHFA